MNEEKNRLPIFQERFKLLRDNLKMTQADFAEYVGISRPTVGFYENGERVPDALTLKRIAEKCEVSADWLIGLSEISNPDATDKAINKKLGLPTESINMLKWLSEEYVEPPILKEINEKLFKIQNFTKKVDAGAFPSNLPEKLTDTELKIYFEHLQNEVNQKNLKTINLLLSNMDGIQIINCIAHYFEIEPNTQMNMQADETGALLVCDSVMLSGMYAQSMIAVMQELRDKMRKEREPNE